MSSTHLLHSSSFAVIRKLEERHTCSAPCFPCLRQVSEKALWQLVKTFGEDKEADEEHEHMDFSLLRGSYMAPYSSQTVELEYTRAPAHKRNQPFDLQYSHAMQKAAAARLRKLFEPVIPVGCALYLLLLGGGYLSGFACRCSDGPGAFGFAFVALALVVQVWCLNHLTILLSQTEVEGRPLLRILKTLSGPDNYYVMTVLCLVDTFSRFTRAQFVGYIAHCHHGVDKPFAEAFEEYGWWKDAVDFVGISGLAHLSFITGPICIQFSYMFFVWGKLRRELSEADARLAGEDMEVMDSMDDLSALMKWAMLDPVAKVLEMAALPVNLDGEEDVERLWDGMITKVNVFLVKNLTDGVLQMTLQAFFFCLVFREVSWAMRMQLLLSIVLAGGPVVVDSIELIIMNRRMTVLAGFGLIALIVVMGGARTVGAFACDSSITGIFSQSFQCLPLGQIELGNWTSGELPG